MTPLQKRFLLFLGGCIPTRLALTALAKYIPNYYLPYLGLVTLVISIVFYTCILLERGRRVLKLKVPLFGG